MNTPTKVPLARATDDELRYHAEFVEGLDVTGCNTRAKLIALLGQVLDAKNVDYVLSFDKPEEPQEQTESPSVYVKPEHDFSSILHAPPITIKVMTTGNHGGKDDVFVSVNTKSLRLARNVPVTLPYPFYEALMNAVPSKTTQPDDPNADLIETPDSNYPVQVLVPVDQAAWAEYQERVAKTSLYA